jgi:nicotinamidase-related amidase
MRFDLLLFGLGASAMAMHKRQLPGAGVGYMASDTLPYTVGNGNNYWTLLSNGTVDLTRGATAPVTSPKLVETFGSRTSALIEPSRSILCIIDMQNYFLHPQLAPGSFDGRAAIPTVMTLAQAFRRTGIPVAWVNWGLTDYDMLNFSPAAKSGGFTGQSMGLYQSGNETVDAGPALMAGTWNVEPYGALKDFVAAGVKEGTDVQISKNRLSALWGDQTDFNAYLQKHEITTIFLGGVDADQCVRTTMMDAYFKGESKHRFSFQLDDCV